MQESDWSTSHSYQFWNKNFTSAVNANNTAILKTIYDPSISCFCLPKTAAFTNFTQNGDNTSSSSQFNVNGSFNKGWNFYTNGWKSGGTILFEALGFRDVAKRSTGTGIIVGVNNCILYWLNSSDNINGSHYMESIYDHIHPLSVTYRSAGFNIRSVTE